MKPLLIVPPAPQRWPALRELLSHRGKPWIDDIELRVTQGVPEAEDAIAIVNGGGLYQACGCVSKHGDVGVLSNVYTRPEQRNRGHARHVMEALVAWFEMTGGKWLYLGTTAELDERLYRRFGFEPIHKAVWAPHDRLTMLRRSTNVSGDPYEKLGGDIEVRDLGREHWPEMVALLQYRLGPDPRVPLAESAVTAEPFALDLVQHHDAKACELKGTYQGGRLTALASLAIDQKPPRTYAMVMPHEGAPSVLRMALIERARAAGFEDVHFPMEALAKADASAPLGLSKSDAAHPGTWTQEGSGI